MTDMTPSAWWALLPAHARVEADGHVLRDARLLAVRAVWQAGRPLGLGLHEAQMVVHDRYVHHGDRVAFRPDPPLDVETLTALASGAPGRVVAVAAVWDGDTVHDWFVDLVAVTEGPAGERRLTTVYADRARRWLDGGAHAPRHPSAVVAERVGRQVAARLAVPFRFESPDEPAY
ncbi:hypothetical protein [Streptomyces thermolilacinus]|uniref:Uncharacterized protein n=1 Tax=Streptomyces thermolilacinus SPC6 TaxID=1306406 RepID=A0A1D3DUZ0_9ACTN|nr:hypothetical protein [Streptomyces thermolilacinus]OEJ96133.1 hypothetical protein J116_018340 [Streptomyces thermolilacinus SPC6]